MGKSESVSVEAAVIRSSLDCIIVIDESGTIEEFNPASERLLGYSREQAIGAQIADLIVPEALRDRHRTGLARYVAGGDPVYVGGRVETDALKSDGSLLPVEVTITELEGERRLFGAHLRPLHDFSQRQQLEDTRRQLEFAVRAAKLGTWTFDAGSGELRYSEFAKQLYGLPAGSEVDFRRVRERIHPEDWPRLSAPYFEGFPDRQVETEYRIIMPDGEVRWLLALGAGVDQPDGRRTAHGILLDITERKRAEAELEHARDRLELALEGGKLGTWTYDTETLEIWFSSRARKCFGYGLDDPIDYHSLKKRLHPDDWLTFSTPYRTGFPEERIEHEYRLVDEGGGIRWFYALGAEAIAPDGHRMVHGVMLEITERKRAQEDLATSRDALHQSEKLAALGSLLAGVSHELNNPLAAVIGQTEMLEEDAAGTQFAERARKIATAAERCAKIVQSFLAMARQQAPQLGVVDINELISSALELTDYSLRTAGISVRITLASNLPAVEGDRDQLHQVFANLIVNAQQAMVRGERFEKILRIQTAVTQSGSVLIDLLDTGPGVPADLRSRIFDPFFTTKPEGAGTGIGLAFSRGIVEAHGGRLTLQPTGHGAHFRIELPAGPMRFPMPESRHASSAAPREGRGRVLVVDDEADVSETLAELLEREGFEVTTVCDGAAALTKIDTTDFDMIVSDLRMPGMSGPEMYTRLRERRPQLLKRLGFVTGDTLGSDMADFLRTSERPVLEKPFTRTGIHYLIAALMPREDA
ncbi:hybrid sensor histidine kinase/response regulator [Tsuneonella sp. HG249]